MSNDLPDELTSLREETKRHGYIADTSLLMNVWLMSSLGRPLLLEGDAGVGKTQLGKTMADVLGTRLIRLQCYEGLDISTAVYEWNYQRQLLSIRSSEKTADASTEDALFSEKYLLERPLLQAIRSEEPVVLLIDEIDRADEEFEAFLLELLSDFQVTVPELGTLKARSVPTVLLTSNGTRELSDALRRRCLYHYIDYPDFEKELAIVKTHSPEISARLAAQIVGFVQKLRQEDLRKLPGIAETLDWTAALLKIDVKSLGDQPETVLATLGCLLKTREDHEGIADVTVNKLIAKAQ